MRTEPWVKITDEEIADHIREGRTAKEIAQIVNMHPLTIRNRIKRLEQSGDLIKLISAGAEDATYVDCEDGTRFCRLDTIIHKATKLRYRIVHIYGKVIVIKRVFAEDYGRSYKHGPDMISPKALCQQYEKRDLGEVKCYIDESLIEKKEI